MRQKKNSVTVSGKVILSTIETMESLGRIGEDILRSHGITKIEEDRQYLYELRNSLHKAAIDRFGEIEQRDVTREMIDNFTLNVAD